MKLHSVTLFKSTCMLASARQLHNNVKFNLFCLCLYADLYLSIEYGSIKSLWVFIKHAFVICYTLVCWSNVLSYGATNEIEKNMNGIKA